MFVSLVSNIYNPQAPDIRKIIKKHLAIIKDDEVRCQGNLACSYINVGIIPTWKNF